MQECDICKDDYQYHEIIDCITCALDARDTYTAGHSQRVSDMAQKICELSSIVLMHHERFDGTGYPTQTVGNDIPVGARIIAICDSIDAMTSNRCYRKAFDFEYCYSEIEKNLGKMYDPVIGRYVLDNWESIISAVK